MKFKVSQLSYAALIAMVIGAVNWGVVGAFNVDVVGAMFSTAPMLEKAVKIAVGVAGLYWVYILVAKETK